MRYEIKSDGNLIVWNQGGCIELSPAELGELRKIPAPARIHHVRELRIALGMTQTQLAGLIGQHPSNVCTIESTPTRQLGPSLKMRLAAALQCKPEDVQP